MTSALRGRRTGRRATGRDAAAASLAHQPHIPTLNSLEGISGWLGTYRERLRVADPDDRAEIAATVAQLEAHYRRRRAELS